MQAFYKYKNWYNDINKKLKKLYGKDYKIFAAILAATSPQYNLKRNVRVTKALYKEYKHNTLLLTDLKKDIPLNLKKYGIMYCHYKNLIKIFSHNFNKNLNLGGNKVNAFYHNLIGNYEHVTIDTWMLHYFNYNKSSTPSLTDYKKYATIITNLAAVENLKPAQMQAIIWTKTRQDAGFKPKSFINFL